MNALISEAIKVRDIKFNLRVPLYLTQIDFIFKYELTTLEKKIFLIIWQRFYVPVLLV